MAVMERHFHEELLNLKQHVLAMADAAQEMIELSVRALTERSADFARDVLKKEQAVNRSEVNIEEEVLKLLATRQPVGGDLRFLTATLKINNDLERVADQACNIADTVLYLLQEPPLDVPLVDMPAMAGHARKMLRDSIHAFVHHDVVLAKSVCARDDEVDWLNDQFFRVLLTHMMESPKTITRAVDLILVSRNLERIADHATNIAEEVIFIEEGRNIKHHIQSAV